jgi:quercetin dioxygenase-like cupin family protein
LTVSRIGGKGKIRKGGGNQSFRLVAHGAESDTLDACRRAICIEGVGIMRISTKYLISIGACAASLALATPAVRAQQAVATEPAPADAELQWFPTPSILPQGAKIAVLNGSPFTPGEFTIEFLMPDKYRLPPHTNPAREHVMIRSGTLRVGLGRKIDRKKSLVLAAGDTATTPAGVPHWSIAEGDVDIVVTYHSGPFGIAYMSVRDEPGSHAFPSGY